jgi:chromosome segregation ATPase
MPDLSTLPTLDDAEGPQAARDALQSARERLKAIRSQMEAERAEVDRLTSALDDLRLDVAAGDAGEDDLQARKDELGAAEEAVEELTGEAEAQERTIERLKDRLDDAREDAVSEIAPEYAETAGDLARQKARALRSLATTLEKIADFRKKAAENGLRRDERLRPVQEDLRLSGKDFTAETLRYRAEKVDPSE